MAMRAVIRSICVLACLAVLVLPSAGEAQWRGRQGDRQRGAPRDSLIAPPRHSQSEAPPGTEPDTPPPQPRNVVPLSHAVSMVQQRFNATAVKTDTVWEGDQMVYRIRLLSADKSRVWTVRVDAYTGRIK